MIQINCALGLLSRQPFTQVECKHFQDVGFSLEQGLGSWDIGTSEGCFQFGRKSVFSFGREEKYFAKSYVRIQRRSIFSQFDIRNPWEGSRLGLQKQAHHD